MKKQLVFRLLACLLALLLTASVLLACGPGSEDSGEDPDQDPSKDPIGDQSGDQSGDQTDDKDDEIDYLLTVEQEDFDKETYTILARADKVYELDPEEDEAISLMEKAVFNRNARVEEYLNVEILNYPVAGDWNNSGVFISTLAASVATTDNAFQLAATQSAYNAGITMNDQYYNIRDYESNIQLDAPWWSASWVDNATINNKLFFLIGDASLSMWEQLYAVFFNRTMAEDRKDVVGDLYQQVRDYEWTIEIMAMLAEEFYTDDGDDTKNQADTFGLMTNVHSLRVMATTCDLPFARRNEQGTFDLIFMDDEHSERVTEVYAALFDLVYNNDGTFFEGGSGKDSNYDVLIPIFSENRALMFTGTLTEAEKLRHAEIQFGIIPFPLYDDSQEEYLAHSGDDATSFGIPASSANPEMGLKVLDALSAQGKYAVVPAYYEVVLQGRVAQDPDSKQMLDLIRQNLYFNFGYIYSDALKGSAISGPFAYFGDSLRNRTESMASAWASVSNIYAQELGKAMEVFLED